MSTNALPYGLPAHVQAAAGAWAGDLAVAAEAVRAGGRAVLEWYGRDDLAIEDPTGRGPVTRADRAAQAAIAEVLARRRPADPVRSEEARDTGSSLGDGRLWVVDPLDGTKEFIGRIPEFSVMVGLAVDGSAVLGAVLQPVQDHLYLGVPGAGAWRQEGDGEAAALDAGGSTPGRLRVVRSRSHPDLRLTALESALGEVDVILSGSVGSKCALLAEAKADLHVHPVPYLKEWDTCAPEAVLRGAGGEVTDCAGGALAYGKSDPAQPAGIFAVRPAARTRVADIVRRVAEE